MKDSPDLKTTYSRSMRFCLNNRFQVKIQQGRLTWPSPYSFLFSFFHRVLIMPSFRTHVAEPVICTLLFGSNPPLHRSLCLPMGILCTASFLLIANNTLSPRCGLLRPISKTYFIERWTALHPPFRFCH